MTNHRRARRPRDLGTRGGVVLDCGLRLRVPGVERIPGKGEVPGRGGVPEADRVSRESVFPSFDTCFWEVNTGADTALLRWHQAHRPQDTSGEYAGQSPRFDAVTPEAFMNDTQAPDTETPPAAAEVSAPPVPSTPPEPQVGLVRHAAPARRDRGHVAFIAVCSSLAGVILGFLLSTAVYRSSALWGEGPATCRGAHMMIPAPAPPPAPNLWRFHQHGDDSAQDGCSHGSQNHWTKPHRSRR